MATASLQELQAKRVDQIDANRNEPVPYTSGEKQSSEVWEVVEGYKHLPGGKRLGPGQRFRPTERQLGNGSLRGKARPLFGAELRDLQRSRKVFAGADFEEMEEKANAADPWSAFGMADSTREYAQSEGMTPADFEGVEPEGANDRYTRAQVEAMAASRGSADA